MTWKTLRWHLLLATLLLSGAAAGRAAHGATSVVGDLTNVAVVQAFEPASGVRLLEIRGVHDGKTVTVWVMISERNYGRLAGCTATDRERMPGVSYSDRSHMVNVVVCG